MSTSLADALAKLPPGAPTDVALADARFVRAADPTRRQNGQRAPQEAEPARRLVIVEGEAIEPRPVNWEWRDRWVRGALNMTEGQPEAGKTSILLDLLARRSAGRAMPDGDVVEPRRILALGAEDSLDSVVQPRLVRAGADMSKFKFIVGAQSARCDMSSRIVLPNDLPLLRDELATADILYVDSSINDLAPHGMRSGDDIGIRALLDGLQRLAAETTATVLATRHLRKGGSRDPLEAGSGTMGIVAKARSLFGVYCDPKDPDRRLFTRIKLNIAPAVPTLACRFTSDGFGPLRVEWLGEDARDARAIVQEIHHASVGTEADPSRPRRALAQWLSDGNWKAVKGLKELATEAGMSWKSIEKARATMGVRHEHRPDMGWCWRDDVAETRNGSLS